jgi:O-antigen/teichoic acid export membrane protein
VSAARRIEERVARSVVYLTTSRVAIQVLASLSAILVARWLSPEDYGVMALAGTVTVVLGMLGELGVGVAIIQFQELEDEELNAAFWATLLLSALLYGVVYAAAPVIAGYFASPSLTPVLRVVGVAAVLTVIRIVPESLLRKRLHIDKVSIVEIVTAALNIPLVLALAWAGAGVWALATGAVSGALVQCCLSFALARWVPGVRVGSKRLGRLLTYSWAALGSRLTWSVYNQSDRIVLGRLAGDVTLGYYAMASQLALLPVEKVGSLVSQILAPVLAESQADPAAMTRWLLRGVRIVGWLVLPMCFGLLAIADTAVPLLLTPKWNAVVPMLQVLCLYAAFRSLALLFPPVLLAAYRADLLLLYNVVLVVVLPLGFGVGALLEGPLGVAVAWAILYPLVGVWMMNRALRLLAMAWRTLGWELWPPVVSIAVMMVVVAITRETIPLGGRVGLVLTILSGAVAHGVGFVLFGGSARGDFRQLFRSLRTPSPAGAVLAADRSES